MPQCPKCEGKLQLVGKVRESLRGKIRNAYMCLKCGYRTARVAV